MRSFRVYLYNTSRCLLPDSNPSPDPSRDWNMRFAVVLDMLLLSSLSIPTLAAEPLPADFFKAKIAPILTRCAGCHGKTGKEGPNDVLVGRLPGDAFPFARDPRAPKTIGSYWPYATTVFDYIRRAMPPDAPGSLRDNEVYGLVAYLLNLNDLIPADAVIDATSLPKVKMPAHDHFVPDTRGKPKAAQRSPRR